jgi:hypothetical protein
VIITLCLSYQGYCTEFKNKLLNKIQSGTGEDGEKGAHSGLSKLMPKLQK